MLAAALLMESAVATVAGMDGETLGKVVLAFVPGLYVRLLNRLAARGCLTARMASATKGITTEPALVARASAISHSDWPPGTVTAAIAARCEDVVRFWTTHGRMGFIGEPP